MPLLMDHWTNDFVLFVPFDEKRENEKNEKFMHQLDPKFSLEEFKQGGVVHRELKSDLNQGSRIC